MSAGSTGPPQDAQWQPAVNPWIIAVAVTLATFMEVLDTSIANVALPHIAGGLSAGTDESTWILTSYLVSNAIVLPLSGWISSIIGRKRFYMSCVAIFTISSFLCGIAPSLPLLILFRVLQGVGGGGLQPSEQAILADTFPPAKRGMAFAVYGIAVVMAPAIGPTLGGWITDNYTWRWIFFINIPVGILSLLLTQRLIQDPPYQTRRKLSETRIDYVGLGFVALGLGTLQVVLDKGQRDDWFESHFILALSIISAVSLIFVIFWEWHHKEPVIDLHLFRERTFATANFLMFMLGFALLSTTLMLPLFMQTLLGYTAERAGMGLSPGGLVVMVLMPLVGFLLSRTDARRLLIFGLTMLSMSLFYMTRFDLAVDFKTLVLARMLQAVGLAFLFVPINTAAYAYLPRDKNNAASGLMNLGRNIGGSVGISFVTTMLDRRAQHHQNQLSAHLSEGNPVFQNAIARITGMMRSHGYSGPDASHHAYAMVQNMVIRQANMLAYVDNFKLLAVATLCMIPLVFLMKKTRAGGGLAVH
jgi:DHA2 family multidrug resistance protein